MGGRSRSSSDDIARERGRKTHREERNGIDKRRLDDRETRSSTNKSYRSKSRRSRSIHRDERPHSRRRSRSRSYEKKRERHSKSPLSRSIRPKTHSRSPSRDGKRKRSSSRSRKREKKKHSKHKRSRSRDRKKHSSTRRKSRSRSKSRKKRRESKEKKRSLVSKEKIEVSTSPKSQQQKIIELVDKSLSVSPGQSSIEMEVSQQHTLNVSQIDSLPSSRDLSTSNDVVNEKGTATITGVDKSAVVPGTVISAASLNVSSMKAHLSKALEQARAAMKTLQKPVKEDAEPLTTETPSSECSAALEKASQETCQAEGEVPTSTPPSSSSFSINQSSHEAMLASSKMNVVSPLKMSEASEFDMFDETATLPTPMAPTVGGATLLPPGAPMMVVDHDHHSNWDDSEGYYKSTVGEILDGRYRVMGTVGSGVFSTVVKCQVVQGEQHEGTEVAVKLVRNNETMRKAALNEYQILSKLVENDPLNKKCIVRLLRQFEHKNHIALVFEPMAMNLREALKKYGAKSGINIHGVRLFGKQMLIALSHLKALKVVHADIKPDNILLNDNQNVVKLCDFGSALIMDEPDNEPTPYLVSRFYRAPEIVLGLPYDYAVDMWSIGCCLYEMFTGKVLFPGSTNNEMLKYFMEVKGKVPNKIVKKHRTIYIDKFEMEPHFDEDLRFLSRESDQVTGNPIVRHFDFSSPTKSLSSMLNAAMAGKDDRKLVSDLSDLLSKIFSLDPSKRISVRDALNHPFIRG